MSLDWYGSKTRKENKYRTAVSNETILATRQETFFANITPVQSITDILLLPF